MKFERAVAALVAPTRNFFAPVRTMEVDTGPAAGEGADLEPSIQLQWNPPPKGTERLPSIILTAAVNLLKFSAEAKAIIKGSFQFQTPGAASGW